MKQYPREIFFHISKYLWYSEKEVTLPPSDIYLLFWPNLILQRGLYGVVPWTSSAMRHPSTSCEFSLLPTYIHASILRDEPYLRDVLPTSRWTSTIMQTARMHATTNGLRWRGPRLLESPQSYATPSTEQRAAIWLGFPSIINERSRFEHVAPKLSFYSTFKTSTALFSVKAILFSRCYFG